MSIVVKKLSAGGDKDVEKMLENASLLGIDIIELLWIKEGGQPRMDVSIVVGFQFPVMGNIDLQNDSVIANGWVDGILKFYPDKQGRCWGYVYDTDYNRDLLASSISSGWFKVVDKSIKDEIISLAETKGYKITVTPKTEVNIKKTVRELSAEKHAKNLENKLSDLLGDIERLKTELAVTKNEKMVHVEKRLAGTPIVNPEVDKDI